MNVKRSFVAYILLFLMGCLFFAPFIQNPDDLLSRNNDLFFFVPYYDFIKQHIHSDHIVPLWQNRILSGSSILGDPQNPLLYLPFYLILLLQTHSFFLILFAWHFGIAAVGMWYMSRTIGLSPRSACFTAIMYAFSPLMSAHLEAGHINMLAAFAFAPGFFGGFWNLCTKRDLKNSCITILCASGVILNYFTIFFYCIPVAVCIFIYHAHKKNIQVDFLKKCTVSGILLFIILAPQLVAAFHFWPNTTRSLITQEDSGPAIVSIRRFITSIVSPYSYGIDQLGTETVLTFGVIPLILAGVGFFSVRWRLRVGVLISLAIVIFFALGLKNPLYKDLLTVFPQLLLFRITTRIWFLAVILITLLAGYSIDTKIKKPSLFFILALCICAELLFFRNSYFEKKRSLFVENTQINVVARQLSKDNNYSRFYCSTNCLPNDLYLYNKGIVDGYNPVQLKNYFYSFAKAAGYRFESYAVGLPPYQTRADKPQPNAYLMGKLGVGYAISPYSFSDTGWQLMNSEVSYVYKNTQVASRVELHNLGTVTEVTAQIDRPGFLKIPVANKRGIITVSEIYTQDWHGRDDKNAEIKLVANEFGTIDIPLTHATEFVTLQYGNWYWYILIGLSLLTSSILTLIILFSFSN